jgi:hypothetical protein
MGATGLPLLYSALLLALCVSYIQGTYHRKNTVIPFIYSALRHIIIYKQKEMTNVNYKREVTAFFVHLKCVQVKKTKNLYDEIVTGTSHHDRQR